MFNWPTIVPPGQRNLQSQSSMLRKNLRSISLSLPDGTEIDLLDDPMDDEITRLALICSVIGVFSGVRNILHAGLIVAAAINATEIIKPEGDYYKDGIIQACWSSDSKLDLKCSVENLMDVLFVLAKIIQESEELGGFNITAQEKKSEDIPFDPQWAIRNKS